MIRKGEMMLHLDDIRESENGLNAAAAGIVPEITYHEKCESEVLNRYWEDLERMSALIGEYKELLIEDIDKIYQASVSILEFDGNLIS